MPKQESLSLLGSLRTLYHLKDVKREGWLLREVPSEICESVAGHCYRTAQAGFHYTGDMTLVKMLLVHDWPESIVGDITPHDNVTPHEKKRLETRAMTTIVQPLPYGTKIMDLWFEYAEGQSPRAKIAKQLDKLDTAVMAFVYENKGYDVEAFFPYVKERLTDQKLVQIYDRLLTREHHLPDSYKVYFKLLSKAKYANRERTRIR